MSTRQEMHLGLIVDSGDVLLVERKSLPEFEGMHEVARRLPGGLMKPSDYSPAAAVHRIIHEQTGLMALVESQPLLTWKQRSSCTQESTRYNLWPVSILAYPKAEITDDTILSTEWVALRSMQSYMLRRVRMNWLRGILADADLAHSELTPGNKQF